MTEGAKWLPGIWLKPVDARRYGWTRVAFGLAALMEMISLWPYRIGLLGQDGVIPASAAQANTPGLFLPVFTCVPTPWWPAVVILAGTAAAVLLIWGRWARIALAVVYLVLLGAAHRSPLSTTGWDFLLTNFAFLLLFSPLGAGWSPARLWKSRGCPPLGNLEQETLPRYGLVLLQIQVAVVYWQTVLMRAGDPHWRDGDFMAYFMLSHHSRFPGEWVLEWPVLLGSLTYLTMLSEIAIPVLLWMPKLRWIGLLAGAALHLGILLASVNIGLFSLVMLLAYAPFLGGRSEDEDTDD